MFAVGVAVRSGRHGQRRVPGRVPARGVERPARFGTDVTAATAGSPSILTPACATFRVALRGWGWRGVRSRYARDVYGADHHGSYLDRRPRLERLRRTGAGATERALGWWRAGGGSGPAAVAGPGYRCLGTPVAEQAV